MVRILLLALTLVFAYSTSTEAGWLNDKLKQAAESVGDRMINDASDSAYDGAKDAVSPEGDETDSISSGQYESGESAELEEQTEESAEYPDEPGREEMYSASWNESDYGRKPRKKKKTGPPRTDLHLTADMIMTDSESGPEPYKGKIYLDGTRSRTEFEYPDANVGMIVTGLDPADKVYILMHGEKTYMESSSDETDSFSIADGKPCDGFHKAENLGKTGLNGRSTVKWRCSEPEDPEDAMDAESSITLWVDDRLRIPVRMEDENQKGYWELLNIREGRPSSDLFKVPAGYKKLAVGVIAAAASLPDQDEQLIKSAGIPLYSKADFVYGNSSVGYRFATSEPVETVRAWYKKKLSSWSVFADEFGTWIIYQGKPGAKMGGFLQNNRVSVQTNDKLPEWHALDESMTTEIVIMVIQ